MNTTSQNWNPFKELNELQDRLATIVDCGGADIGSSSEGLTSMTRADWQRAADISEDDGGYLVSADLPEVKKNEVQVGVENGILAITCGRRSEAENKDEKKKFHRIERNYSNGIDVRTFRLPDDVESE